MNLAWNCKTHFSLLRGFSKCDDLAKKCKEYGYTSCLLADIKTMSGAVDFHQSCIKNGIKPIIGCDFEDFLLIAKNKQGWFDLISCVSNTTIDNIKKMSNKNNLLCISSNDALKKSFKENYIKYDHKQYPVYYVERSDADCHRILLCSGMKTTLPKINQKLRLKEEFENKIFFTSDEFFLRDPKASNIPSKDHKIMQKLDEQCESYDLTSRPNLPKFNCPDGLSEDEYLRQLCRVGWSNKLVKGGKVSSEDSKSKYLNRIKHELDVILRANLSGYFLIVSDIVNEIGRMGWLAGPGRGSAAGCLVSYLVGITQVDPIEHGLIFERFYNEGRNTDGNISLPDIDVDVPAEYRDDIIDYIKQKYGRDNVSQMITFGRLQGRAALKEVLRISDVVSFAEMNEITKHVPNEAEISDQLELTEDKSIINWALDNEPELLKNWCMKTENGQLEGPLADIFEKAIKIEGTNKSQGKHAAGVIISNSILKDICPMIEDKNQQMIAAFEMNDLECQGHVKFDILGIDLLSKVMKITGEKNEGN